MNALTLTFEGMPVQIMEEEVGGRRRRLVSLATIAEVTGMERETLRNIVKRNPEVFEGWVWSVTLTDHLGRPQQTTVLDRDGVLALLLKINTNQIESEERRQRIIRFQRWAAQVLGEVVETGSYSVQPRSAAEVVLAMAQALVEQDRRLAAVESRVIAIESRQREAELELQSLPEPTGPVADLTTRALLNRLIRSYSIETGIPINTLWNRLYLEFRDRYHIDLKARSTKNKAPLDVAESLGHMQTLYNLARHLFARVG